jgi:hypothetical protein
MKRVIGSATARIEKADGQSIEGRGALKLRFQNYDLRRLTTDEAGS